MPRGRSRPLPQQPTGIQGREPADRVRAMDRAIWVEGPDDGLRSAWKGRQSWMERVFDVEIDHRDGAVRTHEWDHPEASSAFARSHRGTPAMSAVRGGGGQDDVERPAARPGLVPQRVAAPEVRTRGWSSRDPRLVVQDPMGARATTTGLAKHPAVCCERATRIADRRVEWPGERDTEESDEPSIPAGAEGCARVACALIPPARSFRRPGQYVIGPRSRVVRRYCDAYRFRPSCRTASDLERG